MSTFTSNLIQQKLMEIKSSLPASIVKQLGGNEPNADFQAILNDEAAGLLNSASGNTIGTNKATGGVGIVSPEELDVYINAASKKYNISPKIIKAVIKAESSFDPNCLSKAGAMGLMQLMPATANGLGVKDPYDPAQNIEGGVKYLNYQLKRFDGNIEFALAAYNAGPGAVEKYGGIPPYAETQNYVKKIMGWING